jgi:homoserine O-acetyltransferase
MAELSALRHPPLAPGWIDRPHHQTHIGDLELESGEVLRDTSLVWVEHGQRNARRDNTVLVCCAIGSTHHRLDFLIGLQRCLDSSRYHIIVIDALGNGLSTSPSNSLAQPGARFPRISIRDMVQSQRLLLEQLGIDQLHAVVGASMGGMQALQWAVSDPARVRRVVAMTPMARTSRWSQLVNELGRRAMFADEACTRARARADAMRLWVPLAQLIVPSSPEALEDFESSAALGQWLADKAAWFGEHGPDAYDWLAQTRAYDAHDLGTTPGFAGDTNKALASIRAATLVLAPETDLYNPGWSARAAAQAIPGALYRTIPSDRGHQAASGVKPGDIAWLDAQIGAFLSNQADAQAPA